MSQKTSLAALLSEGAGARQTPYPNTTLPVKVVKIGHTAKFTGSSGETCEILNFSVADESHAVMASLNDTTKKRLVQEGRSIMVRNFVWKADKVILTKNSKILMCQDIKISKELETRGQHLVSPPSPTKSIAEVRAMPKSQLVTVAGQIVKDEAIRLVKVGTDTAPIHTIRICQDGEEIDVSLWRDLSTREVKVGQYVEISHCLTGVWMSRPQLNSTRNTKITEIEMPETEMDGEIEGVTVGDMTAEIAVSTDGLYKDLCIGNEMLLKALGLQCEDEDLMAIEDKIINMLPIKSTFCVQGNHVTSMSLTLEARDN